MKSISIMDDLVALREERKAVSEAMAAHARAFGIYDRPVSLEIYSAVLDSRIRRAEAVEARREAGLPNPESSYPNGVGG